MIHCERTRTKSTSSTQSHTPTAMSFESSIRTSKTMTLPNPRDFVHRYKENKNPNRNVFKNLKSNKKMEKKMEKLKEMSSKLKVSKQCCLFHTYKT